MVLNSALVNCSTFDRQSLLRKLRFLQKFISWSEKNRKNCIFTSFLGSEKRYFLTSIFHSKLLILFNKTSFTIKFRPCSVILVGFFAFICFLDQATAISFQLIWARGIRAKNRRNAFWEINGFFDMESPPIFIFYKYYKCQALAEFCQNFNRFVFFNRQNYRKNYRQVRQIAVIQASDHTSFGSIHESPKHIWPKIPTKSVKTDWFLSESKLTATLRLHDACPVVNKGKKGSKKR